MKRENHPSTETTKSDNKSEQSNPFSGPCFTDNTKEMIGKSIAIVGAPRPQKR